MNFSILHLLQTKPTASLVAIVYTKAKLKHAVFHRMQMVSREHSGLGLFTETNAYFGLNLQEDPSWTDTMLQLCSRSQRVGPLFSSKCL